MAQLREPIALHDIDDVERLVRQAIRDARGPRPDTSQHDELLADLIGLVWESSLRYDKTRGRSFSYIAYRLARFRTIDLIRTYPGNSRPGRTPAPEIFSFETDTEAEGQQRDLRLGHALTSSTGDPANDRSPDLMRTLLRRNRSDTPGQHEDRTTPARRAA